MQTSTAPLHHPLQSSTSAPQAALLTGYFAGPIAGLKYQTPTVSGLTGADGAFHYRAGEAISFGVGGLVLGAVDGAPRLNLAQLVNRVAGKIDKLHDPFVTNMARLVHTLDHDGNLETGVRIAPVVHQLIGPMTINFEQPVVATDAPSGRPQPAPTGQ